MPLIQLHSFTNLSPPLIRLFLPIGSEVPLVKKSSFPPGEAKNSETLDITIQRTALLREPRVAKLATPTDGAAIECGGCAASNNLA